MTDSRTRVLAAIRDALARGPLDAGRRDELERRLRYPTPRVVPARGRLPVRARIELFITEAERVNATIARVSAWPEVAAAIAVFLRTADVPAVVRLAPEPMLQGLPWQDQKGLTVTAGSARPDDGVGVSLAFAGIAETGTVMILSGKTAPTALSFLPAVHVVVLAASRIVGAYEDAWALLRAHLGADAMPRVVSWITGPSRTADIEQTLLLGAHGPRRLHITIVDDTPA